MNKNKKIDTAFKKVFPFFGIIFFVLIIISLYKFLNYQGDVFFLWKHFYKNYQQFLTDNYLISVMFFIIAGSLWIAFIGIFIPVILFSVLTFGYFGAFYTSLAVISGSLICFFMAGIINVEKLNILKKKINIKNDSFFLFVVLRYAPGLPFIFKNLSGIFFNLNWKKFILACIISDIPQIFLFTYILNNVTTTIDNLLHNRDIDQALSDILLPTTLFFFFLIFLYILKKMNFFNLNR